MKRSIVCACACMYLSGCGLIGNNEITPEYAEYLRTRQYISDKYYDAVASTPRAEVSVPAPGGGQYTFRTFDKPEWIEVSQEAPSEWAPVAKQAISAIGLVGGIYAVGSVASSILDKAAGASYNTGGGDLNLSNVGNKNIAAGSGNHSIHGQENPTTFLLLEGD